MPEAPEQPAPSAEEAVQKAEAAAARAEKAAGGKSLVGTQSIGGLIVVVTGIAAVTVLTIVTMTQLSGSHQDSIVAVTTSAFGIISAVVGAYLGIKISSETNANATSEAKDAAVSQHVAHVASSELEAVKSKVNDLATPDQQAEIRAARLAAGEEAAQRTGPRWGGGPAA